MYMGSKMWDRNDPWTPTTFQSIILSEQQKLGVIYYSLLTLDEDGGYLNEAGLFDVGSMGLAPDKPYNLDSD